MITSKNLLANRYKFQHNERNKQATNQLNIQNWLFTAHDLTKTTTSIQNGIPVGLDKIPADV